LDALFMHAVTMAGDGKQGMQFTVEQNDLKAVLA
jgi:hypothetical protein